ncbi:MAG: NUDIX domain-containing protein [Conexivisphaerales archaeon]
MQEERSAGAVVFFSQKGELLYLLLKNRNNFDLPKGNIEQDEEEKEAAVRETKEETGLKLVFLEGFRKSISYFYTRPGGVKVHKTVVFFAAESSSKDVKISSEHDGFVWLNLHDALKQASHENTREVLKEADAFINRMMQQHKLEDFDGHSDSGGST